MEDMTDDEIIKKARELEQKRWDTERQNKRLEKQRTAHEAKAIPIVVVGEVTTGLNDYGRTGQNIVYEMEYVLETLPKGTKVEITIKVLEVGKDY